MTLGLSLNHKSQRKEVKKMINNTKIYNKCDTNSDIYKVMVGSYTKGGSGVNTTTQPPKNNPLPHQPSSNVKRTSNKRKPLTRYIKREDALLRVKHLLLDFGDKICSRKLCGDLVLFTETYKPNGDTIILNITTDDNGPNTSITMSELDNTLLEYINAQLDPFATVDMINSVVAYFKAKYLSSDFSISFDGHNVYVTGDKKQCVYMKWALIDILQRIYDSEDFL